MSGINNVYHGDFSKTHAKAFIGVAAVAPLFGGDNTIHMQRPSVYIYTETEAPGATIQKLRTELGYSQRDLADRCDPPLDHTTIRRLEHNEGYTKSSLVRVAKVLGLKSEADLFLPPGLVGIAILPEEVRSRIAQTVEDAVVAYKARK